MGRTRCVIGVAFVFSILSILSILQNWAIFEKETGRVQPAAVETNVSQAFLSHIVMSVNVDSRYIQYWQFVRKAWLEVVGATPILVAVGDKLPIQLMNDTLVVHFEPSLHTSWMQVGQWVRIFAAGLINVRPGGFVLISDIDMMPASRQYFQRPIKSIHRQEAVFLTYRTSLSPQKEVAICYNAAPPLVWQQITGVHSWTDVSKSLGKILHKFGSYEEKRGGKGWFADQVFLWRVLHDNASMHGIRWVGYDDEELNFHRYSVMSLAHVSESILKSVGACRLSDVHMKAPPGDGALYWRMVEAATNGTSRCDALAPLVPTAGLDPAIPGAVEKSFCDLASQVSFLPKRDTRNLFDIPAHFLTKCKAPDAGVDFAKFLCEPAGSGCQLTINCPTGSGEPSYRIGNVSCLYRYDYCWKNLAGVGAKRNWGPCLGPEQSYYRPVSVAEAWWVTASCGKSEIFLSGVPFDASVTQRPLPDINVTLPDVFLYKIESASAGMWERNYVRSEQMLVDAEKSGKYHVFRFPLHTATGPKTADNVPKVLGGHGGQGQFLFELYKRFGYATTFVNDGGFDGFRDVHSGLCKRLHENVDYLFDYGLCYTSGIHKYQPTNEYGIRAWIYGGTPGWDESDPHRSTCMHGKHHHERLNDFLNQFERAYATHPKFAFTTTAATHDYTQKFHRVVDAWWPQFWQGVLDRHNDTRPLVMVIFGDHGIGAGPVYNTRLGQFEQGLPVLRIVFSSNLLDAQEVATLRHNEMMLTSHYDTFETLRDLLQRASAKKFNKIAVGPALKQIHGKSLFRERIDASRSCNDAGVPESSCRCHGLQPVDTARDNKSVDKMVHSVQTWLTEKVKSGLPEDQKRCLSWRDSSNTWQILDVATRGDVEEHQWLFVLATTLRHNSTVEFRGSWDPITTKASEVTRNSQYANVETCGVGLNILEWCLCKPGVLF